MPTPRPLLAVLLAAACGLLVSPTPAFADTAEEILARAEANRRVENSTQTITMILYDRAGNARTQTVDSRIKRADGAVMTYARLIAPKDKAGVQFLMIQREQGDDEQYVAFPGAGVNRVVGGSKRGAFLGSDFSYEDLELGQVQKATHTLLGEETITIAGEAIPCYKIESVPKPELKSQYGRIVTWISKDGTIPRQVALFDTRGNEIKRMTLLKVAKDGDLVIPLETEMRNLVKGTRTVLRVDEYRVRVPESDLPDSMFTPDWLAKNAKNG